MRASVLLAVAVVAVAAIGCSRSEAPKQQPAPAPATERAAATPEPAPAIPAAPIKPADWARVDKTIADAKVSDDFDKVFAECMSIGLELAMAKKLADIKMDPDYYAHCEVGPARAEAKIAIKDSKPGKMHGLCIAASMKAEEIAASTRPEAAEFKKIAQDVKKACGL
jgi:hypothetical protein